MVSCLIGANLRLCRDYAAPAGGVTALPGVDPNLRLSCVPLLLVVLLFFLEWELTLALDATVPLLLVVRRQAVLRYLWSLTCVHLAFSHACLQLTVIVPVGTNSCGVGHGKSSGVVHDSSCVMLHGNSSGTIAFGNSRVERGHEDHRGNEYEYSVQGLASCCRRARSFTAGVRKLAR